MSCKSHKGKDSEINPEEGNYLSIDNKRYLLDSLSVTYQNSRQGRSYQILATNKSSDVFAAIEYLVINTDQDLLPGEFTYNGTKDLQNLLPNRFHNVLIRYETSDGKRALLDALGGDEVEGGVLKVTKENGIYHLVIATTIGKRKVMVRYDGVVKSEEFDW